MSLFRSEVVKHPLVFPHGNSVLLVLPEAMQCPGCQRMVRLAINRDGKTRCVPCDPGDPALQTSAPK